MRRTRRTDEFWHFDLAGEHEVEETELLEETVESVTCRWCGRSDAIEAVPRASGPGAGGASERAGLSVVSVTVRDMTTRIDCDTCVVRGLACHDCVVTVLLGPPPELTFDDEEQRALDVLARGGLVPPLRLVQPVSGPEVESA